MGLIQVLYLTIDAMCLHALLQRMILWVMVVL